MSSHQEGVNPPIPIIQQPTSDSNSHRSISIHPDNEKERPHSSSSGVDDSSGEGNDGDIEEPNKSKLSFGDRLRMILEFLTSQTFISMIKGSISYTLGVIIIFSTRVESTVHFPSAFTGMIIVTIAGFPGNSFGSCIQSVFLGLMGVLVGALNFLILAKIGEHSLVGQGFFFAFCVYCLAVIKAKGPRYFGFSLLAIVMSFNGIYTSILEKRTFNKYYLESYLVGYAIGGAIVLSVNLLIFPHSSERELREMLDLSLEHIRIFNHLLSKSYLLTISPSEKKVLSELNQNIRADFGILQQKLAETFVEINWSRFSIKDYEIMVSKTRNMQQALIATYSSLMGVETDDLEVFRREFRGCAVRHFGSLRRDVHLAISEIRSALEIQSSSTKPGHAKAAEDFKDIEAQYHPSDDTPNPKSPQNDGKDLLRKTTSFFTRENTKKTPSTPRSQLKKVDERLGREVKAHRGTEFIRAEDLDLEERDEETETAVGENPKTEETGNVEGGMTRDKKLVSEWEKYAKSQYSTLGKALVDGKLHGHDDSLRVLDPLPSLYESFGADHPRGNSEGRLAIVEKEGGLFYRRKSSMALDPNNPPFLNQAKASGVEKSPDISIEVITPENGQDIDKPTENTHHSLIRVYSWLYSMENFVMNLRDMHRLVVCEDGAEELAGDEGKKTKGGKPKKRFHFHFFESLSRPSKKPSTPKPTSSGPLPSVPTGSTILAEDTSAPMSLREALAILESKPYTPPPPPSILQRLHSFQMWLERPDSIFALKTSAGVIVFASLYWADQTRTWFTQYSLTGGLIALVVAITPTLGQSLITFVFQILGQGLGYLFGAIVCYIFRNVAADDARHYNPYGIACFLFAFSLPMCYVLYTKPMFFVLPFLAMNSAAIITITEYLQRKNPFFDNPGYRLGKNLTSVAISIGLVLIFQLFVGRNPARHTLRKAVARVMAQNLSLFTLLTAYVRATIPADPSLRANQQAISRVEKEMRKREIRLQREIIGLSPLLNFSSAEPAFYKPFDRGTWTRLIRANQIILDRGRDAHLALGTEPVSDFISKEFVSILSPYRRRSTRVVRAAFYAATTSLATKLPLPGEMPRNTDIIQHFLHDSLVLSARLGRTEEGRKQIMGKEFTRYWFYLLSATSISWQLEEVQACLKTLYGELEDNPEVLGA